MTTNKVNEVFHKSVHIDGFLPLKCLLFLLTIFCFFPTQSYSQTPAPESDWEIQLGGLAIYWPEYEGSDKTEAVGFPLFVAEYKQRFFIHYDDGIGIHLWKDGKLRLDVSFASAMGRDESDSDYLQGLGDVDGGATFNIYAEYSSAKYSVSGKVKNAIGGTDTGLLIDLEAAYSSSISDKYFVKYAVISSYADAEHVESFFGINAAQSTSSGLNSFNPDAGIKNAGLQLSTFYLLTNQWNILGQFKYQRLIGDIADSPLVRDKNQLTLAIGVLYQF